jgi:hypothetical protein
MNSDDWCPPRGLEKAPIQRCGFPSLPNIPEWPCNRTAQHIIIGLSGSGYYEQTMMLRCNEHLAATIASLNPPGSPYPYHILGRIEPVKR